MAEPVARVPALKIAGGRAEETSRVIPEETPVALVYDGSMQAVMMATPADLEDFALGFSLSEGIIGEPSEISSLEIVEAPQGIELRMWLAPAVGRTHAERRRRLAGPTGCGLCGVESLEAAVPVPRRVGSGAKATAEEIHGALAALQPAQALNTATRAIHAAAFWDGGAIALVREDVGRHNALDKLVGAVKKAGLDPAKGFIVLTSRVSVEMIQKAAALGAEIVVAVSAPTALALRVAEEAGITLVAVARADAFEVFTHPSRIVRAANQAAGGGRREGHLHVAIQH
jgi:FdhD protein